MVEFKSDVPAEDGYRILSFKYKEDNSQDENIINSIYEVIESSQPHCYTCKNWVEDGYFCGFNGGHCGVKGTFTVADKEYEDCPDYDRKPKETINEL